MSCVRCRDLERALEVRQTEYSDALASAYYRISRKFAAYVSVELERARNELEEHRSICNFAIRQPVALVAHALPRFAEKQLGDRTKTAA